MKEDWISSSTKLLNEYVDSFSNLTAEQNKNFEIKRDHSLRVAEITRYIGTKIELSEKDLKVAFISGLFHDIGRFQQLVENNTFDDAKSLDHAELSVEVLKNEGFLNKLGCEGEDLINITIYWHNKFEVSKKLVEQEMLQVKLLRDADKIDILRVISDYYSQKNQNPNHLLSWELPKASAMSDAVYKEIMSGKMVQKKNVVSDFDVKILQLSWVYDLNFKYSVDYILERRFLEKIYNSLPKTDRVIDVYRKIKVFAENKMLE